MSGALEQWTSFRNRQIEHFRAQFDELFDRLMGKAGFLNEWDGGLGSPALESCVEGDKLVVRVDLPGIDPTHIDVSTRGNLLTIKGSREEKKEKKDRNFLRRETRYGSFERSVALPEGVQAESIKASYDKGVLELTMPAPKNLAAQKVPIQIEAKS